MPWKIKKSKCLLTMTIVIFFIVRMLLSLPNEELRNSFCRPSHAGQASLARGGVYYELRLYR